ncbi:hypothetical protein FSP39_002906 [Pinctada imbricata]|uniref:Uncharacterized protein n=1 Tax=Pinctada imbricata TaxID=66713 RepID=A0AA89C2U1_PINIB|nr:hypothetical protein FSP39_002906 [Pinctada imbricata]
MTEKKLCRNPAKDILQIDLFFKKRGGDLQHHLVAAPTATSHNTHCKIQRRHAQKETTWYKERQITEKHKTQMTTHKPTRPMDKRCRLRTAISRWFTMLTLAFLAFCIDVTVCLLNFQGLNPLFAQNGISPNMFGQRPSLRLGFRSQRDHLLDNALNDLESRAFLTDNDAENELKLPAENNYLNIGMMNARQNEIAGTIPGNRRLPLNLNPESSTETSPVQRHMPRVQDSTTILPQIRTESIAFKNQQSSSSQRASETKPAENNPSLKRKLQGTNVNAFMRRRDRFLDLLKDRIKSKMKSSESSHQESKPKTSQNVQTSTKQSELLKGQHRKTMIRELMNIVAKGTDKDFLRFLLRIFIRRMQQNKRKDQESAQSNTTTLQPSTTVTHPKNSYVKLRIPSTYSSSQTVTTPLHMMKSSQPVTTPLHMMKQTDNRAQYAAGNSMNELKTTRQTVNLHLYTTYVTDPSTRKYNPRESSTQQQTTTPIYMKENLKQRAPNTGINSRGPYALTRSIIPVTASTVPLNQASNSFNMQNPSINSPSAVQSSVSNMHRGGSYPFIQSSLKSEFNWISSDNKPRTHKGISEIKVNANILQLNKRTFSHSMNTSIQSNPNSKRFDLKMNHSFQM